MKGTTLAEQPLGHSASKFNHLKIRTVLLIAVIYLWLLSTVAQLGAAAFALVALYVIAAVAGGAALLKSDLAKTEQGIETFKKNRPLRNMGASLVEFQHVFCHDEDLLPSILADINTRLEHLGLLPPLQKKEYTDTDRQLGAPDTREFFVASSNANLRGTQTALAVHLRRTGAQSIQWWVLMRGFIDPNKKLIKLAVAPIAIPFWLYAWLRQELDLAPSVRTVYSAFYNSIDVVTDARSLHTLVFDALVHTLEAHGVDISDLKQQRAQVMNINISGGRARFGNIIQGFRQASVVQTGRS